MIPSTRLSAGTRIYYFDVKRNKKGEPYIMVTECACATRKRHRLLIYPEHAGQFIDSMKSALEALEADINKR